MIVKPDKVTYTLKNCRIFVGEERVVIVGILKDKCAIVEDKELVKKFEEIVLELKELEYKKMTLEVELERLINKVFGYEVMG